MSAPNTGLHNHPAFLRMMFNFCRLHHSAACFGAVAWDNVDMFCKEAKRTMITVASICKRGYLRFAVLTGKCIIAFTIEIFSHHSCMRRVRLVFVCRLWQKGLAHSPPDQIDRAITSSSYFIPKGNPSGVYFIGPTSVHRHYAVGHWFCVFCHHCRVLPRASSPYERNGRAIDI